MHVEDLPNLHNQRQRHGVVPCIYRYTYLLYIYKLKARFIYNEKLRNRSWRLRDVFETPPGGLYRLIWPHRAHFRAQNSPQATSKRSAGSFCLFCSLTDMAKWRVRASYVGDFCEQNFEPAGRTPRCRRPEVFGSSGSSRKVLERVELFSLPLFFSLSSFFLRVHARV